MISAFPHSAAKRPSIFRTRTASIRQLVNGCAVSQNRQVTNCVSNGYGRIGWRWRSQLATVQRGDDEHPGPILGHAEIGCVQNEVATPIAQAAELRYDGVQEATAFGDDH